jgi:hypothetical protein
MSSRRWLAPGVSFGYNLSMEFNRSPADDPIGVDASRDEAVDPTRAMPKDWEGVKAGMPLLAEVSFPRRLTRMPVDGRISLLVDRTTCSQCRTRFARQNTGRDGEPKIVVTRYPTSPGRRFLVRTGVPCPECGMDLMGPGPEERIEIAFEAPPVPDLEE